MRNLGRRLEALEAAAPRDDVGKLDLEALTVPELERLQAIVIRLEGGERIETMGDDDLRFLAGIRVLEA